MIERKRVNPTAPPPPPSSAYPYSDVASQYSSEPHYGGQFDRDGNGSVYNGAPNMYGSGASIHQGPSVYGAPNPGGAPPIPYGGQNMYNQYSDRNYGAGYGAGAGVGAYGGPAPYAPYSQNPHQQQQFAPRGYPNYNGQQQYHDNFGPSNGQIGGNNQANVSTPVKQTNQLPNPFSETSPVNSRAPSSSASSSSHSRGEDDDSAPPAYSDDDGTYANMQRDQKTPVVMSAESASSRSSPAAASAQTAAAPPPPSKPEAKANGGARPLSTHTVYDPNDAYGGM